jgi:DNA-binding NarL/FixJ family response regulator
VAAIRVLVVDDHAVFSDALATILRTEPDIEVVGKGGTVQEAINAARALGPDVVLLDVHMPDGSGIEAAAAIKKGRPQTQVVILTSDEEESVLQSAIQAGVTGYLSKHETAAQVVQAVRSAARGEALIAPYMLARLLRGLHVQNILAKLNVHSKLEAVSRGIREGWIRIPQEPAA